MKINALPPESRQGCNVDNRLVFVLNAGLFINKRLYSYNIPINTYTLWLYLPSYF